LEETVTLRVHVHTDNHFFSGSEVVLASLLRRAAADPDVEPSFTYRSTAGYDDAARVHLPAQLEAVGLRLPDPTDLAARWKERPRVWFLVRALAEAATLAKVFFLFDVVRLRRHFLRSQPQVVHVNNGGYPGAISCNAAVVAARWARVPVVTYVVNNLALPRRGVRRWSDLPVDRVVARWVTRFVTGSEAAAATLRSVLRLDADQVVVIPNGVDPPPSTVSTLPTLPVPPGSVVLLVAARLEHRKGHRVLLEAVARLVGNGAGPPPTVWVAGDGPERAALDQEIERLGLSGCVSMLGHRDDVPALLQHCDLVVLPSVGQEDFPLVILEAMAAGRPVVATTVAGIPEQVVHGTTGLLVTPGAVDELAAALCTLIDDPERRAAYGKAGVERFSECFSADIAVERYGRLFGELAKASTPCR
jgi:glycosyltransferase involved in cell wall biosynthesis